ncbi:hypothetical protein STENM327S_03372 [Streptomyces tendae]
MSADAGGGAAGAQRAALGEIGEIVVGAAHGVTEHRVDGAPAAEDAEEKLGEVVGGAQLRDGAARGLHGDEGRRGGPGVRAGHRGGRARCGGRAGPHGGARGVRRGGAGPGERGGDGCRGVRHRARSGGAR